MNVLEQENPTMCRTKGFPEPELGTCVLDEAYTLRDIVFNLVLVDKSHDTPSTALYTGESYRLWGFNGLDAPALFVPLNPQFSKRGLYFCSQGVGFSKAGYSGEKSQTADINVFVPSDGMQPRTQAWRLNTDLQYLISILCTFILLLHYITEAHIELFTPLHFLTAVVTC